MAIVNIKTTLWGNTCNCNCSNRSIKIITRGSTAILTYNLFTKVFTLDDIEQVTFIFSQHKKPIKYFNMIEYYKRTTDLVADIGKTYYTCTPVNIPEYPYGKFEIAEVEIGQSVVGLWEATELPDGEDPAAIETDSWGWQLDSHFSFEKDNYIEPGKPGYINFTLKPVETADFNVSDPGDITDFVEFEIVTRLNTDHLDSLIGHDSILIEPQDPIQIIDSLYAKILNNDGSSKGSTVSENLYCNENLTCNN